MRKTILIIFIWGVTLLAIGQTAPETRKVSATPSPVSTLIPPSPNDSGPMPFSNEEANFYRRAWPIDKSHSIGALILFGSVLILLLSLIVRTMAQSGPRKPSQK
jgi:hypothetical protein